jgi:hypothetical protein
MKKMIMLAVLVSLVSIQTIAEGNPLWMVTSKASLTSYAISQVGRGSAQVWAPTSVYGECFTNNVYCELPFGERSDAFKVLGLLKQQQLRFSVVRPDVDQVNSYIGLYSNDGWCMFYGWGYGNLFKDDLGNWFPPDSLLKFETYLNWEIPILSGVREAKVVLRDKDGNVISTQYLNINENGQIMYRRDFLEQPGEIIATMKDGSSIAASLNDDKVYQIIGVPAKLDASIDGVVLFETNAKKLVVNPKSYEGYGESPLVRGTFTQMQLFTLGAKTTEGEVPIGVWLRNIETSSVDEWQYLEIDTPTGETNIIIGTPGTYEFRFEWGSFISRPNDYYYYDGKG